MPRVHHYFVITREQRAYRVWRREVDRPSEALVGSYTTLDRAKQAVAATWRPGSEVEALGVPDDSVPAVRGARARPRRTRAVR